MLTTAYHVVWTVHPKIIKKKKHFFSLPCSAIYQLKLFWCELLSFRDISCKDAYLLSNIMKLDDTVLNMNASFQKSWPCYTRQEEQVTFTFHLLPPLPDFFFLPSRTPDLTHGCNWHIFNVHKVQQKLEESIDLAARNYFLSYQEGNKHLFMYESWTKEDVFGVFILPCHQGTVLQEKESSSMKQLTTRSLDYLTGS